MWSTARRSTMPRRPSPRSIRPDEAVAELHDTVVESVLFEELESGAQVGRECAVAPTQDDWPHEQSELVDQPGRKCLCCQVRAPHQEIPGGAGFQVVDRTGVEVAFEPG